MPRLPEAQAQSRGVHTKPRCHEQLHFDRQPKSKARRLAPYLPLTNTHVGIATRTAPDSARTRSAAGAEQHPPADHHQAPLPAAQFRLWGVGGHCNHLGNHPQCIGGCHTNSRTKIPMAQTPPSHHFPVNSPTPTPGITTYKGSSRGKWSLRRNAPNATAQHVTAPIHRCSLNWGRSMPTMIADRRTDVGSRR